MAGPLPRARLPAGRGFPTWRPQGAPPRGVSRPPSPPKRRAPPRAMLDSALLEKSGHFRGCLELLETKLRMYMKPPPQLDQLILDLPRDALDVVCPSFQVDPPVIPPEREESDGQRVEILVPCP